ncbi:hypothetical protein AVEN_62078-1 [Araneus ventricosus]|uniref:Reverse transcriptase domain-containing protein n=1 Tax=Araneus ventricosus TaxID=182803 RepID=A0A4Y2N0P1_ARAVE|nr:hypothetical protein AVEN_62078-1 [Araneus ventricosus]
METKSKFLFLSNLASLPNSRQLQLLRVIEHIHEDKTNHLATAAIFLDIVKAFDKVWIQGLIHKIIAYHFPPYIIKIICSYLQDRYFTDSSSRKLNAGVSQGGTLTAYIFVLFMNDAPCNIRNNIHKDLKTVSIENHTQLISRKFFQQITRNNNQTILEELNFTKTNEKYPFL